MRQKTREVVGLGIALVLFLMASAIVAVDYFDFPLDRLGLRLP